MNWLFIRLDLRLNIVQFQKERYSRIQETELFLLMPAPEKSETPYRKVQVITGGAGYRKAQVIPGGAGYRKGTDYKRGTGYFRGTGYYEDADYYRVHSLL